MNDNLRKNFVIEIEKNDMGLFELKTGEEGAQLLPNVQVNTYKDIIEYILLRKSFNIILVKNKLNYIIIERIVKLIKELSDFDVFILEDLVTENNNKCVAYRNGYRIAVSGLYPETLIYKGIKHIFIDAEEISESLLKEVLFSSNINSSVIGKKNDANIDLGIAKLYKNTIIDLDGNINKICYPKLKIDELKDSSNEAEIVLNSIDDYVKFVKLYTEIYLTGKFKVYYINVFFQDECMWLEPDNCKNKSNTRVRISNKLTRCDQILNYLPLKSSIRERENMQKRGEFISQCANCEYRTECCRCLQVLTNLELRKIFCKTKKEITYFKYIILIKNVLKSFIKAKQADPSETVYLSAYPHKGLLFDFNNYSVPSKVKITYFLWKFREKYFVFLRNRGIYLNVSERCAFMLEIMYVSRDYDFIKTTFLKKYEETTFYEVINKLNSFL